jgi:hypothetical protein
MHHRAVWFLVSASVFVAATSCSQRERVRKPMEPPQPSQIRLTRIEYVDSDSFDGVLESALVSQDPAIVIATGNTKPEWGPRLNAWIAAWNRGGPPRDGATFRSAAPLVTGLPDGETIREFRLLIESLMDRIEERVRNGSAWWQEERMRNHRIALLKPYNLRFHMAEDRTIQVILFHGRYASSYADFLKVLGSEEDAEWHRGYTCSLCQSLRAAESDMQAKGLPPAPTPTHIPASWPGE